MKGPLLLEDPTGSLTFFQIMPLCLLIFRKRQVPRLIPNELKLFLQDERYLLYTAL